MNSLESSLDCCNIGNSGILKNEPLTYKIMAIFNSKSVPCTIVPSYVPSIFRCFNRMVRWFIFWKCATNFWLLGLGKSARYLPLWVRFIPSKTAGNSSKEVVMCIKIVEQGIFYPSLFDSYRAMWYKY